MKKTFLLVAGAAAALSVAACNRPGGEAEKEKNKTEESGNSSSEDEDRDRPKGEDERGSERERGDGENNEETSDRRGGSADEGEEFGSNLRRAGREGREDRDGRGGGGNEAELRDALRQAAREQQARLPLRDGITTVYDVEADGTEFIVSMRVAQNFTDEQFERLEQAFRRNTCNGDSAELIRLGATTTYRVTDSEGERRSYSFDSC